MVFCLDVLCPRKSLLFNATFEVGFFPFVKCFCFVLLFSVKVITVIITTVK